MSFIAIADLHLSHLVPVCRRETPDEWIAHQKGVLDFIAKKCNESNTGVVIAGDIFDKYIVSEEVVNMFLSFINSITEGAVICHGNHDMNKRSKDFTHTSFGIVKNAYECSDIVAVDEPSHCIPYTDDPVSSWDTIDTHKATTRLVHTLCYQTEAECVFGGCSAQQLLDKVLGPKILVVGDQHHGFVYENDDRKVINCGCILKRSVDFKDEILKIWYVDDYYNVQAIELPKDDGVHDEHRVEAVARDGRVTVLVEKLVNSGTAVSVDFVKNAKEGLTDSGLSDYTKSIINEILEEV